MVSQRIRNYELMMVISPEADEERVTAAIERVNNFITQRGGEVSEQENWGMRHLAYPIKRFREGNYILTKFTLDAENAQTLDRTLNASDEVLRHLVMKS